MEMEKDIQELRKIADELHRENQRMVIGVREGGKQTNEGMEMILQSAHRLSMLLSPIIDRLFELVKRLEKSR